MLKMLSAGAAATVLALMVAPAILADEEKGLKAPADFASIEDQDARSVALFEEMFKVLSHPRCVNCHPPDNSPRQAMDSHMHNPPVERGGETGFGAVGMRCSTCHGTENVPFLTGDGSIPGHDPWHLAPIEMAWLGKSSTEICEQLKDPARNGDRTLAEIQEHNAEDGLVGWGWHPGEGREPAPGSQEVFGELTKAWIETGALCP